MAAGSRNGRAQQGVLSWHRRCLMAREPYVCLPPRKLILMPERLTLPVLQIREVALFPGVPAPGAAGRPTTQRAIEAELNRDARLIFTVAQRRSGDAARH